MKDDRVIAGERVITNVEEQSVESSASAVEWSAILAGAVAAMGVTAILVALGPGLGLSTVTPWSFRNADPATLGVAAGIWMVVMQWLSSAFGGYLTGRMRKKWVGIRTDEVLFRDTAHGLLAWALATLVIATLVALGTSATAAAVAASPQIADTATTAEGVEHARRIAIASALITSISLLVGAFIGAAAGALGGFHRDEA
jgi:hypothetical protein